MPPSVVTVRPIRPEDDAALDRIIRRTMAEFGATADTHTLHEEEIAAMSAHYRPPAAAYWVVERDGEVMGGGGIGPLAGAPPELCELRKMYFVPEVRGLGLGRRIAEQALAFARQAGYRHCYLQTRDVMRQARALYEKLGFRRGAGPSGVTGQFGCDAWYDRAL